MAKSKCKNFETCNSPLCPFDLESLENGIWYSDEAICRKKGIDWVNKQQRIKEVKANPEFYFDISMLNNVKEIRAGIQGTDPNKERP